MSRAALGRQIRSRRHRGAVNLQTLEKLESNKLEVDLWWLWHIGKVIGIAPAKLLPPEFLRTPGKRRRRTTKKRIKRPPGG
jgi:hypothetical protein